MKTTTQLTPEQTTLMPKSGAPPFLRIDGDGTHTVKTNRRASLEVSAFVVDAAAVSVPAPVVEEASLLVETVERGAMTWRHISHFGGQGGETVWPASIILSEAK